MAIMIKDIAKAASVSVPAVSAVLNNKTNCRVSPDTRARILHFAKEMDYKPNFSGLLLSGKKTRTVALLIGAEECKSADYFKDMIISLISQYDQQGYACYLADMTGEVKINYSKVLELIARGVHNFVFLGCPLGHDQIGELIKSRKKNYVVYGSSEFLDRSVVADSASGAAAIIRFFLSRGKTNFRLLINPLCGANFVKNTRICGLMAALPDVDVETLVRRYVIEMDPIDIEATNFSDSFVKRGYDTTAKLLEKDPGVQAIFYLSDFFAIGGAKFLQERGYVIGKDILLAGFNETFTIKNYSHPISSVEHDISKITKTIVAESLKENIQFNVQIPTIVHIRE